MAWRSVPQLHGTTLFGLVVADILHAALTEECFELSILKHISISQLALLPILKQTTLDL